MNRLCPLCLGTLETAETPDAQRNDPHSLRSLTLLPARAHTKAFHSLC
jgi:hypothetical protein